MLITNKFFVHTEKFKDVQIDKKFKYICQDRDGFIFASVGEPYCTSPNISLEWITNSSTVLVFKNDGSFADGNENWQKAIQKINSMDEALDKILKE